MCHQKVSFIFFLKYFIFILHVHTLLMKNNFPKYTSAFFFYLHILVLLAWLQERWEPLNLACQMTLTNQYGNWDKFFIPFLAVDSEFGLPPSGLTTDSVEEKLSTVYSLISNLMLKRCNWNLLFYPFGQWGGPWNDSFTYHIRNLCDFEKLFLLLISYFMIESFKQTY